MLARWLITLRPKDVASMARRILSTTGLVTLNISVTTVWQKEVRMTGRVRFISARFHYMF